TGVESLNLSRAMLSNALLSAIPALPSGLTTLDLRYNNLNLALASTLNVDTLKSQSALTWLYLYGNPGTTADNPPDLSALQGKLFRVDLAPIGLEKAERLWDDSGNAKSLDAILDGIVKALHYLPLEIFDYVHNNFAFELYRGAMKGTLGVIQTHAG